MKKVLLIGSGPLPEENERSRPAAGLRTYQFLKPLLRCSHVEVVTIGMPECYIEEVKKSVKEEEVDGAKYRRVTISKDDPKLVREIQKVVDEFKPSVIVGVNTYPSYIASLLKFDGPIWADLNGWFMAEAQAQAYKMKANDYIPHYSEIESAIVRRADKFSTVSDAQRFALIGELASQHRLVAENFGVRLVEHIPNGTEWFAGEDLAKEEEVVELESLKDIPADAFVLAWIGGYNTWVDEVTLYRAVAEAMDKCDKLHYVSTGGEISGLDDSTYAKFRALVEQSEHKNRFKFLGWVETNDIPYIYKRADAGINVDRKCIETETGARNRINEMMKFGLPVITTLGSEISYEVLRVGAGVGVESGNVTALAGAICNVYEEWRGGGTHESTHYHDFVKHGQAYIAHECNYDAVMKPLIRWIDKAERSPDSEVEIKTGWPAMAEAALTYLKKSGVKKFLKKLWQKITMMKN